MNSTVSFEPGQIPVSRQVDVLVAGAGTAGAFAAIAAARMGARTLVIEQYGSPGGSQTLALVTPIMHSHIAGNPQSSVLAEEVRARMIARGAAMDAGEANQGWFDPMALTFVLEEMLEESGCEVLYHTTLIGVLKDDDRVTHAVVFNDDGIQAIAAGQFVDCTGDGDLSVMAGARYESGNDKGYNQAISLRFQMTNVDLDGFRRYLTALGEPHGETDGTLHTCSTLHNDKFVLSGVFDKAWESGELTEQDIKYFQCFSVPGKPRDLCFNCPELGSAQKTLDGSYLSRKQSEGRKAVGRLVRFLQCTVGGFEHASLCAVAPMLGLRETRRIVTEYVLTGRDILRYARFDDFIATSNYPVDIHDAGDTGLAFEYRDPGERYYQLPFRSLVVSGIENLFVAGRCLGADFAAQASVRVQHTCKASGEAAGIGAALAALGNIQARQVDGADVRAVMTNWGARFI